MPSIRIRDLENGHLAFDLIDLLEVIGDAGAESTWRCVVEDFVPGDSARYLSPAYEVAEHGISGALLWQLATNTRQVIDGTFKAFRPNDEEPWVSLQALDSSWWVIAAPNEETLLPFRARFAEVEDAP